MWREKEAKKLIPMREFSKMTPTKFKDKHGWSRKVIQNMCERLKFGNSE